MKFEFNKSLGQNFLKNDLIVSKIVDSSEIDKDTLVIEIGPGSGILTKKILSKAGFAILYEIDTRLEKVLNKELENYNNYELIFNDFLKEEIEVTVGKYNYKKLYIIANLPYYITTPIIKKIIDSKLKINKMVIMIQKEVANRLVSKPNSSEYGSLTVFLNYYYNIRKLFDVSKNEFIPKPKVDSSVIELVRKDSLIEINDFQHFNQLLVDSFRYKRKNLRNNLFNYDLEKIEKVLNKYNLNLNSRAESLSVEVFADISNSCNKKSS